jgi:MFS family permease
VGPIHINARFSGIFFKDNLMETPIAPPELQPNPPLPVPQSIFWRITQGFVVTILTLAAFTVVSILKPEWQDGKFASYIALMLSPEASWIFAPLLGYSVLSLLFLLAAPVRWAQFFWTRLGIYTGVLLALQFTILALIALEGTVFLVLGIWIAPLIAWPILRWLARKIGILWTTLGVPAIAALLFVGYLLVEAFRARSFPPAYTFSTPFLFLIGFLIASAPFWSLLIMGTTGYRLLKHYETRFTLLRGVGTLAWLGGFAASLSLAIMRTLQLYSELPTQPPDCYIATAAANGHPRLVRSREVTLPGGARMRVNAQLQRLKCAELALKAVSPRLHGVLRKLYDNLGRPLARRMTNPFVADAAYLLLKPFEWILIFGLRWIGPEINILVQKLYN